MHELDTLLQSPGRIYREGGGSRPLVREVEVGGETCVLKDFGACDRWFATLFGAFLAKREARALERLAGVPGIPAFRGRAGRRAILMQRVDGVPALKAQEDARWTEFFAAFTAVIDAMHGRGVAHCDLRSPHNILAGASGKAWLVDFTGSWTRRGNPASRWLFRQLCAVDRSAVIKLKARLAPDLLTEEENDSLTRKHRLDGPARAIGSGVRDITRALFTRKS